MRHIDRILVQAFFESFEVHGPVLEIGSHQLREGGDPYVPYMDLRPFSKVNPYIGSDFRFGPGVDLVQDGTQQAIKDRKIGSVITVSTVEHVFRIFDLFNEIERVLLKEEGSVVVSSHMDQPIHGYPSDYWRFTPEAFSRLLDPFPAKLVGWQGVAYNPHAVFGVGFKEQIPDFKKRANHFRSYFEHNLGAWARARPFKEKVKTARRFVSYRIFGSKDAFRKNRDEHVVGWHVFPR